ncbi:MAG: glycosyltransferase family 2 protein [Gemmatimonadales bacterium]|nr:glycosyltransferase family 2 protein [Gemmatimonadales bacterium]
MTLEASVIVPTYNRPLLLQRCLAALAVEAGGTQKFEVIVVDDASPAHGVEAVVTASGPQIPGIRYLRHEVNRGRSTTANTGIREARGHVLLLVDDDVVVEPGYLAAHLRVHRAAEPQHVAVVGNLRFPEDIVRSSNYARYLQSRYLGGRTAAELARLGADDLHPRFLLGGVTSVLREDALAAGMFDEAVRYYGCEDHMFANSLRRIGVRIVYAPEAEALHYDAVGLDWYRAKVQETARDGVPELLRHDPQFLEESAYADLLPIARETDRGARLLRKVALRAVLNPAVVWALERWSAATDRVGWLYSDAVCRALSAGWFLQGLRMPRGERLVVYGR